MISVLNFSILMEDTKYQSSLHESTKERCLQGTPQIDCYDGIGVLRSSWLNNQGKIRATNFGTAFLLTPRLLMTCSHNIYAESLARQADRIEFLPNFSPEKGPDQLYYRSSKKLIIKRENLHGKTLKIFPLAQEICIILLQKPIYTQSGQSSILGFQKINSIQTFQLPQQVKIKIIGYPKSSLPFGAPIHQLKAKREQRHGFLQRLDNDVIHYTNQTEVGHSGSPIFALSKEGQYKIVGIHTHKGLNSTSNCGVFFNSSILKRIKGYIDSLRDEYGLSQSQVVIFHEPHHQSKCQTNDSTPELQDSQWQKNSDIDSELNQIISTQITWQQIFCCSGKLIDCEDSST